MDLVVFDLDGTLLDARSKISPFTRRTLERLSEKGDFIYGRHRANPTWCSGCPKGATPLFFRKFTKMA